MFRYEGRNLNGVVQEDWLNDVVPALMHFRSYVLNHGINISFFTLDAGSVSRIDASDPTAIFGALPVAGQALGLQTPTNQQSSEQRIRAFVDTAIGAT